MTIVYLFLSILCFGLAVPAGFWAAHRFGFQTNATAYAMWGCLIPGIIFGVLTCV